MWRDDTKGEGIVLVLPLASSLGELIRNFEEEGPQRDPYLRNCPLGSFRTGGSQTT